MRRVLVLLCCVAVAGCSVSTGPTPQDRPTQAVSGGGQSDTFGAVVSRVEPVAEQVCRQQSRSSRCDFKIILDNRPGVPANAFQTVDRSGRPVLIVTGPLLKELRNPDEVAFVLSHEAAHHIAGHLPQTNENASAGAILAGIVVAAAGADQQTIKAAQEIGAQVGALSYSKQFELEADALGAVIAHNAGYDPVRGVAYFTRSPDPGDQFLGSHPPNAARIQIVREVAAQLN